LGSRPARERGACHACGAGVRVGRRGGAGRGGGVGVGAGRGGVPPRGSGRPTAWDEVGGGWGGDLVGAHPVRVGGATLGVCHGFQPLPPRAAAARPPGARRGRLQSASQRCRNAEARHPTAARAPHVAGRKARQGEWGAGGTGCAICADRCGSHLQFCEQLGRLCAFRFVKVANRDVVQDLDVVFL
jgi:hypothetical protein